MSDSPLGSLAWAELCRARRYDVARALDLVRNLREGLRKPEEIRIADLAADLIKAGVEAEEEDERDWRPLANSAWDLAITSSTSPSASLMRTTGPGCGASLATSSTRPRRWAWSWAWSMSAPSPRRRPARSRDDRAQHST